MKEAQLAGSRILILEDDYYLASDTQAWLENAGLKTLGPTGSSAKALNFLRDECIDAALVDINLGTGPSFEVARALEEQGVPFAFVTGYDDDVIAADLGSVPCLQKPVKEQRLLAVVKDLLQTKERGS